jgi:hypothetical protein
MDDPNLIERNASEDRLQHAPRRDPGLARVQAMPWLIVIALLAAVAWLGWRAFFHEEEGDIVGSAMLAFEEQNSLTVFSSRFEVVAESVNRPSVGPLDIRALETRQAMIVPALVEYRLDLSEMDRGDFAWNADTQTLDVILPGLRVSTPNIDEAAARYFTDGLYVSRDASVSLSRNNSRQAAERAATFAKNPQILALARKAAAQAIRQNLAIPLQVAGYGDVTVNVRFEGQEPAARQAQPAAS